MKYIKELTAVGRGIVAADATMHPDTRAELVRIFELIDWGLDQEMSVAE